MNFYIVIIGTEILNARREDKHFRFVQQELAKYGHEIYATFVIKDDVSLMNRTYNMIKEDDNAIIFSFGGIGSTPDDLTRAVAANVFTNAPLQTNEQFKKDIIERFGDAAYPHRIHMADLPQGAELLFNPVNNMSGFSLEKRFFFVPGFPSMSHPMITDVIKRHFSHAKQKVRKTLLADTSEETLIDVMQTLPKTVELSSLPMFVDEKPKVELSLSGENEAEIAEYFNHFKEALETKNIPYKLK